MRFLRGRLFYGEPRRRTPVDFTQELRQMVRDFSEEMHQYARRGHTPRAKPGKILQCLLSEGALPAPTEPAGHGIWPI